MSLSFRGNVGACLRVDQIERLVPRLNELQRGFAVEAALRSANEANLQWAEGHTKIGAFEGDAERGVTASLILDNY